MNYRIEPVEYLYNSGLREMAEAQWHEEELRKDVNPFEPDWAEMQSMQESNRLRFYAMRDGEKLAGFAMIVLVKSILSQNVMTAFIQDFYVAKEYRKGMNGVRFLQHVEKVVTHLKPTKIVFGERPHMYGTDGLSKFYTRLGYEMNERLWTKHFNWTEAGHA